MIKVNESRVEEALSLLLEVFQEAEADPLEAIAACVDVIDTLADEVEGLDRDSVLDWAVRRLD